VDGCKVTAVERCCSWGDETGKHSDSFTPDAGWPAFFRVARPRCHTPNLPLRLLKPLIADAPFPGIIDQCASVGMGFALYLESL